MPCMHLLVIDNEVHLYLHEYLLLNICVPIIGNNAYWYHYVMIHCLFVIKMLVPILVYVITYFLCANIAAVAASFR